MFFALQNLMASTVFKVEKPWEWTKPAPYGSFSSKEIYKQWCKNPKTDHMFFSGFEGLDPAQRIKAGKSDVEAFINPPYKMHGFVCDYDGVFNGQPDIDKILKNPPVPEYMPSYVASTFSGHCRVIWRFESPILLPGNKKFLKAFLAILIKKLKANRWFAGMDEDALNKPEQYYEAGADWLPIRPDSEIPSALLNLWAYEAAKNIRFADWDKEEVSLSTVKLEIDKRWPGAFDGPFVEGVRCRRFWDSTADNETAAVVHKDGFQCFTGHTPFVSWRDLLGTEWIDSTEATKMARLAEKIFYDASTGNFWRWNDVEWRMSRPGEFHEYLRTIGFASTRDKSDTASGTDRMCTFLRDHRRVIATQPFIFEPQGLAYIGDLPYLNTSRVKVMEPAAKSSVPDMVGVWGIDGPRYFPFLHGMMSSFFDRDPNGVDQLLVFLCWLKHFYENAYILKPQPGQCVFFVGKEGKGKTLLAGGVLGKIMGGSSDGADWLVNGSTWTDNLVHKPLILIDDSLLANNRHAHMRFCALLKKLVANPDFAYNGKWKATGETRWNGRAMGLCNNDLLSKTVLPTLESSNKTKIDLFLTNDKQYKYPRREEITAAINQEGPNFCRFLMLLVIPNDMINYEDTRFHLQAYQHPQLYQQSLQAGQSTQVLELLQTWLKQYRELYPKRASWKGTMTELYQELAATQNLAGLLPRNGLQGLLIGLSSLAARGYPIQQLPTDPTDGLDYWKIATKMTAKLDHRTMEKVVTAKEEMEQEEEAAPCTKVKVFTGDDKETENK